MYYKHYFENERGIAPAQGISEFGTLCHSVLERYGKGELAEFELLDTYEKEYPTAVEHSTVMQMSQQYSRDMGQRYYQDGYEFFKNFEGLGNLTFVDTEKSFTLPVDDFFLTGKIDAVMRDDKGNLVLVDYKSKKVFKSLTEQYEYARQLYVYAFAAHELYGEWPTKMGFLHFRTGEWTWIDFNDKDYEDTLQWCKDTVKLIENETEWGYSNDRDKHGFSFFCWNFCDVGENCPHREEENV